MAIGYVIQLKKITVGALPGMKFIARIFREKKISQKMVAKDIAARSAMSIGDVLNVLQTLQEVIAIYLSEGKSVKLDLLGTFYPTIKSKAVNTKEEATAEIIEKIGMSFYPTVDQRETLSKAGVKYIDTNIKGVQYKDSVVEES